MSASFWAWATTAIMTASTVWYIALIVKNKVAPPPAAWIIACVAMNLSFATYWSTPNRTLIGNIGNLTAGLEIFLVTFTLLVSLKRRSQLKVSFDRFQYWSLVASAVIVLFWKQPLFLDHAHRAMVSFVCVQVMLVLSYVVMLSKVLRTKKNHDSIMMWVMICIASLCGLAAAELRHDPYGIANSIRSVASAGILAIIMTVYDIRNGRWSKIRLPQEV